MSEIYKTIIGYSNYEISNLGNVRNIKTGKFLKACIVTKGYLSLYLHRDNENRHISVKLHRLVAENFLNKIENYVIDHIDNNKTNNKSSNLQYVSNRYNIVKQKLYSNKGFVRRNIKNKRCITYTIEYRTSNGKRTSFTSNNLQDCLIHYCNEMDNIDISVSKLVRNFYNL